MRKTKALTQCYALQDLLFKAANDAQCSKQDLSRLSLSWARLEERKRILRGRPLPGSLRPKEPKAKKTLHFHDLSSCVPKRIVHPDLDQTNQMTGPETPVQ
jgi:hypothetical protein